MKFKLYGYGTRYCSYCDSAKKFLSQNYPNAQLQIINIDQDKDAKNYIIGLGHKTVPQIFVNYEGEVDPWNWIGGFDRLVQWNEENKISSALRS